MHHEMPTLTPEHKLFTKLAGNWTGDEKMFPMPWDPAGGSTSAKVDARLALDGFCLTLDYEQSRDGQVSYRGHGVYAYDSNAKEYLMTWFDTMSGGIGGTSKGKFDGKVLAFQSANPMGHSRYSYHFEGDGKYVFKIEVSEDGKQWMPMLEGKYARR